MKGKNAILLKMTVLILAICAVVSSLILAMNKSTAAWVIFVVSVVASCVMGVEVYIASRNIKKYVLQMDKEIEITEKESLYNFPAPAVIVDENLVIVWYNKFFQQRVFSEKEAYGEYLTSLVDVDVNKLFTKNGVIISHEGRMYRVVASKTEGRNSNLSMIYFEDITKYKALETEHFMSHPSVILIMIDNYEDLLSNIKESEKARVLVQLEKLLENFMDRTTGILRKISNDRFVAVIEERHLQEMLDTRFDILDKARAIMVDERMCVTLSIGVGRGGETLKESEALAKQALDMALGRGGDQCAVKNANGFEFFGGVSKGIEKQTKVKTRIIATALNELIDVCQNVYIMGHKFGDLDSVGSAIGLAAAIRRKGKVAHVVVDSDKNLARKLIGYIRDNDIVDLFISPQQAISSANDNSLLIVVDTHSPDFVDSKELLKKCRQIVVIDHHRKMVNHIENAVIFHHEPYASSASEMVAELIQYFGDNKKISAPEAEALLAGIMLDTKNFVMKTGVRTFEAAAFLRKLGADTVAVKTLFSSSIETYQLKCQLVEGAMIYHNCAIACSNVKSEDMRVAAPQASDELLGISGVKASFVLFELNGVINISARSYGTYNVQLIMETLGGGGHQTMAGVQLTDIDIETAKQKLIDAIEDFQKKSS